MSDLKDWRGQPIEVGSRIIWRQGATRSGTWKLGLVVEIHPDPYSSEPTLEVDWTESSSWWHSNNKARGVKPYNVTVWPVPWGPPVPPHDEQTEGL